MKKTMPQELRTSEEKKVGKHTKSIVNQGTWEVHLGKIPRARKTQGEEVAMTRPLLEPGREGQGGSTVQRFP